MIRLLLALHPKSWRKRYGEELAALLEDQTLTPTVVLDVLGNAARQHAHARRGLLQVVCAFVLSAGVEWFAVAGGFSDNILWLPDTGPRAALLAAVLLPWVPVAVDVHDAARRRWHERHHA